MKIYTYKEKAFGNLKNKIKKDGNKIIPIQELQSHINEDDNMIIYLDITSLIKLLKIQEDKIYEFEHYLIQIPKENINVEYIVDEKLLDDTMSIFKYVFDENMSLDLEFNECIKESCKDDFISITNIDIEKIEQVFDYIDDNLIGHINFKAKLKEKIKAFRLMNKIGESKVLSIFLLGESGIGKSEVARCLQKALNNNGYLTKINLGNYSSKDALNSLIGSPLGYIGSEDGGELTQKIIKSNTGIVLIDEFEKADEKVFNFFLELLEDGQFTNNKGQCINLNEYIIIFTSNLSKEEFFRKIPNELITRFDYICNFTSLSYDEKFNYADMKTKEILSKLKDKIQIDENDILKNLDLNDYKDVRNIKRAIISEISKYLEV